MKVERIQYLLDEARKQRLLVVGDVMLDEFVWGKVSRISPEAPVPVVEVQSESFYPGGAGKCCAKSPAVLQRGPNKRHGRTRCCRWPAEKSLARGRHCHRGARRVCRSPDHRKNTNYRAPATGRARGSGTPHNSAASRSPVSAPTARIVLPEVEGVIFEDYGKGFLTQDFVDQVSAMIAKAGKIFTADPNPGNPLRWTG